MREEEEGGSKLKELPRELWREVGIRLENEADVQMFRSTFKLWRTLVPSPLPSIFPLKIPTPPPYNEKASRMDFYIAQHTAYLIDSLDTQSTNPLFLVLESKPDRHGFYPFRLFASGKMHKKDWSPPHKLDLQRLRTRLVYKAYYLHFWTDVNARNWGIGETCYFQKLVLFSNSTTKNNPLFLATEKGVDLVAVALLSKGDLAHLTININNPSLMEWKLVNHLPTKFDDIIYYGGRLWGVDLSGGAFVMKDDNMSLSMTRVAASPMIFKDGNFYVGNANNLTPLFSPFYEKPMFNSYNNHYDDNIGIQGRKRLVEASGGLYMLFPCRRSLHHDTNQIMVYQLIISKKEYEYEWVKIESIGNKAFFVGHGFSFSMEIGAGTGLCFNENPKAQNGNCIFLNGLSFCRSHSAKHDFPLFKQMLNPYATTGVYSLVDNEFEAISPLDCPQIYCHPTPTIKKSKSKSSKKIKVSKSKSKEIEV
ncbi:hypothetical protein RND81_12G002700 [Saponaria officinalis]|uniref:KIB1-4 beta-propeller domain-containing protein n=1 Tax=Saponaria officinalis TaxID=3572 RepID=A0AAW1H1Q9_SAPOF